MLKDKCVLLGVTGGIAAYKAAEIIRLLKKSGCEVHVIMTRNATQFITPLTLQTLSENPVNIESFNLIEKSEIGHISLAQGADAMLVCPATANILGKAACGIADDLLSTTIMTVKAPVIFAPAMNTDMWESPAVQSNIARLKQFGYHFVEPGSGELACKTIGKGRLADLDKIIFYVNDHLLPKPLAGKRIVVTAGPTREYLDPVRYISNRSSGKMGYALAAAARLLGAKVTLVSGPTSISLPNGIETVIQVETAQEMLDATQTAFEQSDALIMCAAVADFRPVECALEKSKKEELETVCQLAYTPDIVKTVAQNKGDRLIAGFAAETRDLFSKAKAKMKNKNLDFIIANDVSQIGIGFDTDDNEVRIFGANGSEHHISKRPKSELAFEILQHIFVMAN